MKEKKGEWLEETPREKWAKGRGLEGRGKIATRERKAGGKVPQASTANKKQSIVGFEERRLKNYLLKKRHQDVG